MTDPTTPQQPDESTQASATATTGTGATDGASAATSPSSRGEVRVRLFGRTDVGQVREHNEDNFIVADLSRKSRGLMEADRSQIVGSRGTLLGVCDGMGGAAAGEVASQLAVDVIYEKMTEGDVPADRDDLARRLVHSIEQAGFRIYNEAKADRTRRGMGTTSTIAALLDDHLFLGQVGDSRGYILREGKFVQVTRDQSLVTQLIENGQLTPEEAENFEHNNIILQALGTSDTVQVDLTYVELREGDTLLLCSDGLSGMVRNDELKRILESTPDPLEACKILTEKANQAGGHDNITCIVAKFDGSALRKPAPTDPELKYRKYSMTDDGVDITEPGHTLGTDAHRGGHGPSASKLANTLVGVSLGDLGGDKSGPSSRSSLGMGNSALSALDDPVQLPVSATPKWLVLILFLAGALCIIALALYLLQPQ
ncbi:MAG: Stp1/IreP family PP2C-type Ser/Thr phosphatase [Polyangiaceae bacterium]